MRVYFLIITLFSLVIGRGVAYGQQVGEEDPSLFHFGESYQMLHGQYKGYDYVESCSAGSNTKVSSIKYKDYIYVVWLGVSGSVNIACIGSTHLKELTQEQIAANRNVYHGFEDSVGGEVFSAYSPTLAVLQNKLYVLYNNITDGKISYLVISEEGTVNISSRGIVQGSPTDFVDITAIGDPKYSRITLYGSSVSDGSIRMVAIALTSDQTSVYPIYDRKLGEKCIGRVGVCSVNNDKHLIAWTGTDNGHQLNTAYIDVINSTLGDKHTYSDHSSHTDGPVLFRKDNPDDLDVHILWRGANADNKIWQGVFNVNNKNSFQQYSLPTAIAVANVSPTLLSLNEMVTYMFWPTANTSGSIYSNIMMAKALDYPYDAWMERLIKDEHTLKNLVLPGSNNAGMNDVLQASHFPSVYQALEIPDFGDCNECGFVTQTQDIKGQLESGYRYFGLNLSNYVYTPSQIGNNVYFPDGNILHSSVQPIDHLTATCLGQGFESILDDAKDFLNKHPKELVIINIKDLNPDALSFNSIIDDLEKILPRYKDVLYQKQSYQKSLGDIINERIGDFRGKIIITAADSLVAQKVNLLRDIFEVSHDNANRYINTTNTSVGNLAKNQINFFNNNLYQGSYKRMDWQLNLTVPKIACDLRPLKSCMESPKPGLWHHITHIVGCAAEVFEMGYTVFKAATEPEDPRSWITMAGWVLGLSESSSLAHVQNANKHLYPTVFDMTHSNTINKNNRVNIIYTDASDYLYTDLCMQLISDFNEYDDLSVHNSHLSIADEHISVTCGEPFAGVASIKVTGGHAPYQYYWETTGDSTSSADSLSEGYHKVRIIDAMRHVVTHRVYVSMSPNAHAGLANRNLVKTEVQPLGLSNHYEVDCDNLIAKVESNNSSTGVRDTLTAKVWIDNPTNDIHVRRHFELLPQKSVNTATGRITLYFTQGDFDAFNESNSAYKLPQNSKDKSGIANIMIYARMGASIDGSGGFNSYENDTIEIFPKKSDIIWSELANRWEVSFYTEGFGAYFLSAHDGTKQNEWLLAKAYLQNGVPYIQWQVQERDIDRYYVEYSFDRSSFGNVGVFDSKGSGKNSYSLEHNNLQLPLERVGQSIVYYRIRQVDNDGLSSFSNILPINIGKNNNIFVYPNPFTNQTNILSNKEIDVIIMDVLGSLVAKIHLFEGDNKIHTNAWSSGLYFIKTIDGECHKILKAN